MHQPFDQQMILTVGDKAIDTRQRSVFVAAERVDLTKRKFISRTPSRLGFYQRSVAGSGVA